MTDYQYPLTAHALVNAAHSSKLDQVKRIIESGINPDDYTGNSMPALVCASANGNYEIVEYLLSKKAHPNNYTEDKISALKSAADIGNLKIVELLLKAGADPNYERNGNVALTLACDSVSGNETNRELIELLLPITDQKYYQRAYEYCTDIKIRDLIKQHSPNIKFIEPNEFGGPKYKQKIHYETPPKDPIIRQCWELLGIYIETCKDPNRVFEMILTRCSLSDSNSNELYLSNFVKEQLKRLFDGDLAKVSKNDYIELYQILETEEEPESDSE